MVDPYFIIMVGSSLVALSYIFDVLSKKLKIPSVLFLIGTGMIAQFVLDTYYPAVSQDFVDSYLPILGVIGLIMIVLEAAVDLDISGKKLPVIKQSLLMAFIVLLITSLGIALAIMFLRDEPFFNSLVYAIPLSVVSSAVLIPSVHTLSATKKEFMIYESTFSDIIGIMFFNFVVIQEGSVFSISGLMNIVITIVLSIIISYLLVYFFSKISKKLKLFLMVAVLVLLYAIGKELHFSSLLMIFIFGLVLNNAKIFFTGLLAEKIDFRAVKTITNDFRIVTAETAFVVRTFFFVAFGMFIDPSDWMDWNVIIAGSIITFILYIVRYLNFKIFLKTGVLPEIFLAPRGLITILLFFSIPVHYQIADFSIGILSFVILATSIIMMIALMATPSIKGDELTVVEFGLSPIDEMSLSNTGLGVEPSGPFCEIDEKDLIKRARESKFE